MSWIRRVSRILGALLGRGRFERDMDEEMAHHLDLEIGDRIRSGMPPAEARRTALRDFGGVERWKDEARTTRGLGFFDAARQDLRYAARSLRGSPAFTAVATLTLALGIGATTAVFTVVDGLLLRPLDFHEPDRIVRLLEFDQGGGGRGTISSPNFYDWVEQSTAFESAALYDEYSPTLLVGDRAIKIEAASVSASFFEVLGVEPLAGRFFVPEEDEPGSARVVLSAELWRDAFGADPEVLGSTISLSGFAYTVVGVAPPMEQPRLSFSLLDPPRLWRSTPSYFPTNSRGSRSFTALARLEPGVTVEEAEAELVAIHAALTEAYPEENRGHVVRMVPLIDDLTREARPVLFVLSGAVALVLLAACANVANLLLFRSAARGAEIGVRTALGAPRSRIVRQLMVESWLLAGLGAAGGILVALAATRGLVSLAQGWLPRAESVGVDLRVLLFALLASSAAAVLFGLAPALRTSRTDVASVFSGGARGSAGAGGRQGRGGAVTVQVALATVVMLGAGLLGRSLAELRAVDPGFAFEELAVLRVDPPTQRYDASDPAGRAALDALHRRLEERLASLPGVTGAGLTDLLPLSGSFNGNSFAVVGRPEPGPGDRPGAETRAVSPGYHEAMGIPLLRGRALRPGDDGGAERALVVSESFVRLHFPGEDPLGAQLRIFDPEAPPARIVGVVADVHEFGLESGAEPMIYLPLDQAPAWMLGEPWVVLRTAGDPAAVLDEARAAIQGIEPLAPLYRASTMSDLVSGTLARPRFRAATLLAFAAVAFLLAAAGVYGMIAYTMARRTHEMGLRMAIGADRGRVVRHVLGLGLRPVAAGLTLGLAGGATLVRSLDGLLFGVQPTDPLTFVVVSAAVLAVAALAAWIPARRAAALSPTEALRTM